MPYDHYCGKNIKGKSMVYNELEKCEVEEGEVGQRN